jgi:hypothetical protein
MKGRASIDLIVPAKRAPEIGAVERFWALFGLV